MNIYEAINSGKPFSNPDMIGAWLIVDKCLVHRDSPEDFNDLDFIRKYCVPLSTIGPNDPEYGEVYWMTVKDLIRTDWRTHDLVTNWKYKK